GKERFSVSSTSISDMSEPGESRVQAALAEWAPMRERTRATRILLILSPGYKDLAFPIWLIAREDAGVRIRRDHARRAGKHFQLNGKAPARGRRKPLAPRLASRYRSTVSAPTPPTAQLVVSAERLSRSYGRRRALDNVSFTLEQGQCLALFGPNGAGKTTLLRVLAGLLRPSGGEVSVAGVPLPGGAQVRAAAGLISHQSLLYPALTARENVEFAASLHGVPNPGAAALAALTALRIVERADAPVRSLSRGMQQRVSIARAIVHSPALLLLDEPYTGLDESGARALTAVLRERRENGAALLLVTHNLHEGLELATQAAILRAGRFVRQDSRSS